MLILAGVSIPDWGTLQDSSTNGGFSYGNNTAIRPFFESGEPPLYDLLLNPDAENWPQAITTLINFMNTHPQVGIVGSGIEEVDGKLWPITFRFPSIWSELDPGSRNCLPIYCWILSGIQLWGQL